MTVAQHKLLQQESTADTSAVYRSCSHLCQPERFDKYCSWAHLSTNRDLSVDLKKKENREERGKGHRAAGRVHWPESGEKRQPFEGVPGLIPRDLLRWTPMSFASYKRRPSALWRAALAVDGQQKEMSDPHINSKRHKRSGSFSSERERRHLPMYSKT